MQHQHNQQPVLLGLLIPLLRYGDVLLMSLYLTLRVLQLRYRHVLLTFLYLRNLNQHQKRHTRWRLIVGRVRGVVVGGVGVVCLGVLWS